MDTKLATMQIREQQWAMIIQDRINSGLNVAKYCELNNLSRNKYFYWLRKIKEHAIESQPAQMVELTEPKPQMTSSTIPEVSNYFCSQMLITVGNTTLSINDATSSALLARVLEVINHAQ